MGTTWSVQLADVSPDGIVEPLRHQIQATLDEVEHAMSTYREDSEISAFNRQRTTDWFPVSEVTAAVLHAALETSRISDGAFDITVYPLVNLWGFGPADRPPQRPSAERIHALLSGVGYTHLELRMNPPAVRKKQPGVSIDLSAIAKGYAVDRVAAILDGNGFDHYLVEIGGELRARGHNASGIDWRIAVERPDPARRAAGELLPLRDVAVATSGDYRNFFEYDGRLYSHTIDPRTGEPVDHALGSVTVIAATAMQADALATALLVLGPEDGAALARTRSIAALFIERKVNDSFEAWLSPAMEAYLQSTR